MPTVISCKLLVCRMNYSLMGREFWILMLLVMSYSSRESHLGGEEGMLWLKYFPFSPYQPRSYPILTFWNLWSIANNLVFLSCLDVLCRLVYYVHMQCKAFRSLRTPVLSGTFTFRLLTQFFLVGLRYWPLWGRNYLLSGGPFPLFRI